MKTLEYPLCATTLSHSECTTLMGIVLNATLPKAHICRRIPSAVKYGSTDALGLGIRHLYDTQGIDKVILYCEYIRAKEMMGPLLRANLEWCLIHIGIGGKQLFDINYKDFDVS